MSRAFFPKLLTMPMAHELADLRMIQKDLQHVQNCCAMLLEKEFCMLGTLEGRALLDSLCIRYRRCFGSGVRTPLKTEVLKFSDESRELHEQFYSLADKHIAHSVNNYELNATTLYVAISETGEVTRGGLGNNGTETVGLAPYDILRFEAHVKKVMQGVEGLIERYTCILTTEATSLSDEDIKALPNGFAPIERNIEVAVSRKWPKKAE